MTPDSLIQIIALIVAVYALVPRTRQLEIKMRFGFSLTFISILYILASILFFYYPYFRSTLPFLPEWTIDQDLFTPSDVVFFLTLSITVFLWVFDKKSKISIAELTGFQELIDELMRLEQYEEAIYLLKRHWERLTQIHEGAFFTSKVKQKIKNLLIDKNIAIGKDALFFFDGYSRELVVNNKLSSKYGKIKSFFVLSFRKFIFFLLYGLSNRLRDNSKYSDIVGELFQSTLHNEKLVQKLATTQPYFSLQVLALKKESRRGFLHLFFESLLHNEYSVLYREIRNNQELEGMGKYIIKERNRFLFYLFSDIEKNDMLNIWKPIGDTTASFLRKHKHLEDDPYNKNSYDWEDEIFQSPISISIRYFDIMVSSALHQNIKWHMWLYYFTYFVELISKNINPHSAVDETDEWPTRYHFFLYDIFNVLKGWIDSGAELVPMGQSNVILRNKDSQHENDNILKSSIIALSQCVKEVVNSDTLSERFKQYLVEDIFRIYFNLGQKQETKDYAFVLKTLLKDGYGHEGEIYWRKILDYYSRFDKLSYSFENRELVKEFPK